MIQRSKWTSMLDTLSVTTMLSQTKQMNRRCLPRICFLQLLFSLLFCRSESGNPSQERWLTQRNSINITPIERKVFLHYGSTGWKLGGELAPCGNYQLSESTTQPWPAERTCGRGTCGTCRSTDRVTALHPFEAQIHLQILPVQVVLPLPDGNHFALSVCAHIQQWC